ncbi:MAG: MazG nucleotide pyrophosphohydrolase domain-containing protein [Actinomycetota bacterium]
MHLSEFQDVIRRTFVERDAARGVDGTFRWMVEEVGELAKSLRGPDRSARTHEAGDVLAWLASVANLAGVDLEEAAARYGRGCPSCGQIPCACPVR